MMSEDLIKRSDALEAAKDQSYIAYEIRRKIKLIPSVKPQILGKNAELMIIDEACACDE